jgi:Ca2+-binding EF-hand superfamily protein
VLSKSERDDRQTSNVVEFLRNAIATKRKLYGRTVKELSDIFKLVDRDGSGTINHEEFRSADIYDNK